jgi:predicted ester cyclase
MTTDESKTVVRRLYDAANARDYEALREVCTSEFGEWLVRAVRNERETMDAPWQVLEVIAEPDRVAVRWRREGTHDGDYFGVPARGRRLRLEGVRIWRFEDGRLADTFGTANHVTVLRQLGVLPPEGEVIGG